MPPRDVCFLTGPNMAGKSTYMKTLGMAVYLAHEGVQKVFGTLDLFVSLLETEIKYPILQGGILPFWTPSSFLVFWDGPFVPEYLLSKDYNLLVIYYRFEILK